MEDSQQRRCVETEREEPIGELNFNDGKEQLAIYMCSEIATIFQFSASS